VMLCRLIIALWALAVPALAVELPSCEADTEQYCLGDDKDMSPEGIDACLTALADRSQRCTDYLALLEACKADISGDGICAAAHGDGETVPCLVQRTKPESLSESCQGALPKNELKGLAKFWEDGKRQLNINEISELNADDKDTYNRWQKKKKGKKTEKDRERDFAVKGAKRERVITLVTVAAKKAASAGEDVMAAAEAEAKQAMAEDMTGTLKPLSKAELTNIVKEAKSSAKSEL